MARILNLAAKAGPEKRKYRAEASEKASGRALVLYLKERNFLMLKEELILRNPLRLLEGKNGEILPPGGFGAVLARAGVGKTALLVQIALNGILQGKNVLHISLKDPVRKVALWYEEVLRDLAREQELGNPERLLESILPNRLIMTFKVEGFSAPKLEERLTDLTIQGIFAPQMILVDGLPFDETPRKQLAELKDFVAAHGLHAWFTVRTHRHDPSGQEGIPAPLLHVADLFEIAMELQPRGEEIHLNLLKGGPGGPETPELILDPSTLLVKKAQL
jgi:hypothetical protein